MQQRWINRMLAIALIAGVFTSCKKDYSKDDPLPEVYTPSIFVTSQNAILYAFTLDVGVKKFEYPVGDNAIASPIVFNGDLYVTLVNGRILRMDINHPTVKHTYNLFAQLSATPIGDAGTGLLYVGTSNDSMYAIDTKADTIRWRFGTKGQIISSPTIYQDRLIFGSYDGSVYAVSKFDGHKLWSYNAGVTTSFYSSPTKSGKFVYIGASDGNLYALDTAGNLKWKYHTNGEIKSSPIIYGGNVIFGSNDYNLYCIDSASGKQRWAFATNDRIESSPYAFGQVIYVGSYDYNMYAVNILDGTVKWKFPTSALIKSSPMVYDGRLYFGGYDKYLYALDTSNGGIVWKQNINGSMDCSPLIVKPDGSNYNTSISGAQD